MADGPSAYCMDKKTTARLTAAVLLYERNNPYPANQETSCFASVHGVVNENGSCSLTPGVPATVEGLLAMYKKLMPEIKPFGFLSEKILSFGNNYLVWWHPPQTHRLWFACEKLGQKNALVPCPGLVFVVYKNIRSVFALKGSKRPTPQTKLYQAPFFNVYGDGRVCEGTSGIPDSISVGSIEQWESSFFDSRFTHPNVHHKNQLVLWKKGVFSFWKIMLSGKIKKFPRKVLVCLAGKTVGGLINAIEKMEE